MRKFHLLFEEGTVFALGLFIALGAAAPGKTEPVNPSATPEPLGYVIEDIHGGNVQVLEEGETSWEKAVEGQRVEKGDEVKVGKDSEASLVLEGETSLHLDADSDLKISRLENSDKAGFISRLHFLAGRLLADVRKNLQASHSAFEVESNGVVCGVRGTAFEVKVEGDDAQISTHEGEVEVAGGNETHRVTAGNFSSFKRGRFLLLRRMNQMDNQRFQKWRLLRRTILQKRVQRLNALRNHLRKPWQRRHPRLSALDAQARQELMRKKLKRKFRQGVR